MSLRRLVLLEKKIKDLIAIYCYLDFLQISSKCKDFF